MTALITADTRRRAMQSRGGQHQRNGRRSLTRSALVGAVRARLGREEGFTLVELIVVMLIAAIVSVAVLAIFSSTSGAFYSQTARIQNQDDARTAINQMARYLRMATSSADNQSTQSNAIVTSLPKDVEFYCDLLGDGVPEKVRS
jgi:prepilin-type N-terminal cleavage/methylation domain-containing protein